MTDEQLQSSGEQPIIIVRKRGRHGGHHGGAWKVAFADFMTSLMAFFLVMWLVGQKQEIREAVAGYFRDPGKFKAQGREGALRGTTGVVKTDVPPMAVVNPPAKQEANATSIEREQMSLAARSILDALEKQQEFQRLKKNIKLQMTSEGLRIILNESENSPAFFEPGSAKLLQKSAIILVTIARELGKLENHLVIEGHTDSSPNGQDAYSNWDLSTDRANSARALMDVSGLYRNQVRQVRGFADRTPMITSNPSDQRNRRVTILVLYKSLEDRYDRIEIGADLLNDSTKS
ncbi:MAG: OmpA family protein [candidate division Zixibacteria bacterium]|nr:OmpA family protein [candidate division Zixibacteria bacterium]